jgi:hypothetical protein
MPPAPRPAPYQHPHSQHDPRAPGLGAWLQAGVTAMLVVLFVVIVGKTRQQNATIRQLQERVQGLENSRALERTTGLEQQLRTTVERLQAVERKSARIEALSAENANLRLELRRLRGNGDASGDTLPPLPKLDEPAAPPPLPSPKPPAPAN